jgi:ABC-type bacteriocin/lantibiotic exporter with double-glycine peptidase domain
MSLAKGIALRQATNSAVTMLPVGAAFVYGGYMAVTGRISVGGVMAAFILTDSLAELVTLGRRWPEVQRSVGAFQRVQELLDSPRDLTPTPPTIRSGEGLATVSGPPIQVKGLSFEYEAGRPVLDSVSFEIPAGAKVAIVGKSGCGKSTLLKLLAGLYAPDPGTVFVNGLDMHYERLSLGRRQAAYIPQEPFLSSGTVRENLTLSSPAASPDDIAGALESADSAGFVEDLPGRLDAQVGERGSLLSGGQCQRLCVARGLLRRAPIMLLDEPTSSLDAESERRIAGALSRMHDMTCVIVTHRF